MGIVDFSLAQLVTGETRAIHLWHEMWRRAGVELNPATGEIRSTRFFQKLRRSLAKIAKSSPDGTTPVAELLRRHGLKE
jgi:hypothetical protein